MRDTQPQNVITKTVGVAGMGVQGGYKTVTVPDDATVAQVLAAAGVESTASVSFNGTIVNLDAVPDNGDTLAITAKIAGAM